MEQTIHVLHVVGKLNIGGAESRIMDLYRNMDRTRIQFDFMQHTDEICAFQKEVESLGGHVYHVPRFRIYNIWEYCNQWKSFFLTHPEIKVVHGHMTSTASIYLPIARKYGNVYTIAHARSAGVDKGIKGMVTRFLRRNLSKKCNQCFTCSKLAGEAVFGNKAMKEGKVQTIPNAIEVSKFAYDEEKRRKIRSRLGIEENAFVIGHVGRFDVVKNHEYIINVFMQCFTMDSNCRLLLVGDGPLKETIQQKVQELGIEKAVLFVGNQKKVEDFYQAFDFFILPSYYEGLPGTVIEAQASGLAGMISDTVTDEAIVTDLMWQKSINLPSEEWAKEILTYKNRDIKNNRVSKVEEVRKAGFDVKEQADRLSDFYIKAVK